MRIRSTSPSFFKSIPSNIKKLTVIGFLARIAKAANTTLIFEHHGTNYLLKTDADGQSSFDVIATKSFEAVSNMITNGTACRNVTIIESPTTEWNTSWVLKGCKHLITLARDASQEPHVMFEQCSYNTSKPISDRYNEECEGLADGATLGNIILTVLAVMFAFAALSFAIRMYQHFCQTRYQQIPESRMGLELDSIHHNNSPSINNA